MRPSTLLALLVLLSSCHSRHARTKPTKPATTSSAEASSASAPPPETKPEPKPVPVGNFITNTWTALTAKLKARPAIERQLKPEVAPQPYSEPEGCTVEPRRHPGPLPTCPVTEEDFPMNVIFKRRVPPRSLDKEVFLGTEVDGKRQGPWVFCSGMTEYFGHWGTDTIREGMWVAGVKDPVEYEYSREWLRRVFTRGPADNEAEAIGRCGDKVIERTHYRNGKLHGTEEHFFLNGAKEKEASWIDGHSVGVLRIWAYDGTLREETTYIGEYSSKESTKQWQDHVLILDEHHGFKVTRYPNGFKQSEVLAADDTFYGVKRAWFSNGQPMLSVDVNGGGFQVGTARHWTEDGKEMTAEEWAEHSRQEANRKSMEVLSTVLMIPISVLCALK